MFLVNDATFFQPIDYTRAKGNASRGSFVAADSKHEINCRSFA